MIRNQENQLKKYIIKKCFMANKDKRNKDGLYKPKDEIVAISQKLHVSLRSVWNWYTNDYQPTGQNYYLLPEHFNVSWKTFYRRAKK